MRFMWMPVLIASHFLSQYLVDLIAPPDVSQAIWPLIAAGLALYGSRQSAEASRDAADTQRDIAEQQRLGTQLAIRRFTRSGRDSQDPGQLEYMDRLREQMESGALPVDQLISAVSQRTNEQLNIGEQRVRGQAFSAGLGRSAASASAVGRVQSKALQAIAEQSRAISIENEMTKTLASDKLGQIGLAETDAMRQRDLAILNASIGAGTQYSAGLSQANQYTAQAGQQSAAGYAAIGQYAAGEAGWWTAPPA